MNRNELSYPEFEQLRLTEENGQLGENKAEHDVMVMGCSFQDILHAAYPSLGGDTVAQVCHGICQPLNP